MTWGQDHPVLNDRLELASQSFDHSPRTTSPVSRHLPRPGTVALSSGTAVAHHGDRSTYCLARAALTLLDDDAGIGLTSSTATDRVVELLTASSTRRRAGIVVTNSLRHAELLAHAARQHHVTDTDGSPESVTPPRLLLLGGQLDPRESAFHGPDTVAQLRRLRLDVAVMTATVVLAEGLAVARPKDAAVATALLAAAARRIVIVDSSSTTAADDAQPIIAFTDLHASDFILLSSAANQLVATALISALAVQRSPHGDSPSLVVVR